MYDALADLETGLGKCTVVERRRQSDYRPSPRCTSASAQSASAPCRAGLRGADRLLEQRGRLLPVARVEPVLRSGDAPPVESCRPRPGGVRAIARSASSAASWAAPRPRACAAAAVERRCDLLVRAGGRDREMAGALLRIDVQVGEAAVEPTPPVQRHVLVADGCEQGMRESDPVAVELEHAPLGRPARCRRPRSARSGSSSVTEGAPSAATATSVSRTCAGSALSRSATRARRLSGRSTCRPSARIVPSASARPTSSAKNGFPPTASCTRTSTGRGRLSDSRPHRSRWIAPTESGVTGSRRNSGEGAVELERRLDRPPAHRRQDTDRLGLQPPEHEAEDLRRARIDPLRVVDRDEQRPLLDEDPDDREQRRCEQPRLRRRPVRLADQERDLERTPLDRHELRQRLVQHRREQVADGREGRSQLGMGRARRENPEPRSRARRDALLPERRLADPRVALEQQCRPARRHSVQKLLQRNELQAPADDLLRLCGDRYMEASLTVGVKPGAAALHPKGMKPARFL